MRVWFKLAVWAVGAAATLHVQQAAAQSDCLSGTVLLDFHVNGTIKVCPAAASKVPELQKQLDAIQKTLAGNQTLLREMTRSARSVNSLGRDVDENRQIELLRSFNKELQKANAASQEKTQNQIADLADKLATMQDLITQKKEDEKTQAATQTALLGSLGDAVAKLDFTKAESQLESIQAKLDAIGGDVQETRKNTEAIKETLAEREAREKAAADLEAKKAKELDEDPNMYARAQIMALGITPFHYMIYFYSRPPLYPPFANSQLSIAFHKGSTWWRVDATDKEISGGGELWKVHFKDVGERATICFVADDKASGRKKEWMQRYNLTPSGTASGVNWIPDGTATMQLTDGGPCDGATQVQSQAPEETAEDTVTSMRAKVAAAAQAQAAQAQQQMAQMREQSRGMAPAPMRFAMISAQATRRASSSQWVVQVTMQPSVSAQLFDVTMQANLVDASGRLTPLQLSNREMFANSEIRRATPSVLTPKAVVCVTAKDAQHDKPYRLTQWFTIETNPGLGVGGFSQFPGEHAAFVPSQPATVTEASEAPCR